MALTGDIKKMQKAIYKAGTAPIAYSSRDFDVIITHRLTGNSKTIDGCTQCQLPGYPAELTMQEVIDWTEERKQMRDAIRYVREATTLSHLWPAYQLDSDISLREWRDAAIQLSVYHGYMDTYLNKVLSCMEELGGDGSFDILYGFSNAQHSRQLTFEPYMRDIASQYHAEKDLWNFAETSSIIPWDPALANRKSCRSNFGPRTSCFLQFDEFGLYVYANAPSVTSVKNVMNMLSDITETKFVILMVEDLAFRAIATTTGIPVDGNLTFELVDDDTGSSFTINSFLS